MSGLSCALIVIFVLTVTSLAALYFFVTRHQRRFRQQSRLTTATDHESTTTTTDTAYYVPSKELLYFFWWNNQSRVGLTPQATARETRPDPSAPDDLEIDVLKLIAALQGHTRSSLFTITEENKMTETTDQFPDKAHKIDKRTSLSSSEGDIIGRLSLAGSFGVVEEGSEAADPIISSDEEDEEEEEEEVMTTPNASPPYLTPSDSPLHDHGNIDTTFHVHSFTANSRGRLGFRRSRRPRAELKAKDDEDEDKVGPVSEQP